MAAPRIGLKDRGAWIGLLVLAAVALAQGPASLRFGDGLELVAVSTHLGVAHPPGYPLFTSLLHGAIRIAPADPYAACLWVCRAAAALCASAIFVSLRVTLRWQGLGPGMATASGLLFASAFLLGGSLWPTMHVVEVYSLHGAFAAAIAALLVWHGGVGGVPGPARVLAACALQGLALAHHLTSVALLPLVLHALVRSAREEPVAHRSAATAGVRRGGARGLRVMVGVALVILPPVLLYASLIARAGEPSAHGIAWGGPEGPASLLRHVRGAEYGASQFLMEDSFTRFRLGSWFTFALRRVEQVVASAGGVLVDSQAAASPLGWAAAVLGGLGAVALVRCAPGAGWALIAAIGLQLGFVLTYNIADIADYFLGIHVLVLPLVVTGVTAVARALTRRDGLARVRGPGLVALPLLLSVVSVATNADVARPDSVGNARNYQERLLRALPPDAAVLTAQSGDLFLLWYTRFAEQRRTDLFVFPSNLHDRPWVRRSLPPDDPRRDAVRFSENPMERLELYVAELRADVIDPLFQYGRVFTTIRHVEVLESLARHYEFRKAAELFTREEIEQLRADERPRGPSILWELRPRRVGGGEP